MVKQSLSFASVYFVVAVFWQWVANKEISWIDNIGIGFVMFLSTLLIKWSNTSYNWKEDD